MPHEPKITSRFSRFRKQSSAHYIARAGLLSEMLEDNVLDGLEIAMGIDVVEIPNTICFPEALVGHRAVHVLVIS